MTVISSSARKYKEFWGEGSFELAVTRIKRKGRGVEDIFEVVNYTPAGRAIKLLGRYW